VEGEWLDLLVKAIGAALKGWVNAQLSKFLPALGEWGALIVGALLYWKGGDFHAQLKNLGEGLLIASVAQLAARYIPGVAPAPTAAAAPAPAPTVESYAITYAAG
jgi:hypothetical protein